MWSGLMARDAAGVPHDEMAICCKIVTINVDSSVLSQHGFDEADVDSRHMKMDDGKRALERKMEMTTRGWTTARTSDAISMVRAQLRGVDDDSYAPHYVPIGPYHRNRSSPGIDKEKVRSAGWLQRLSEEHTKADDDDGLTGLVEELEPLARECYDADAIGDMTPEQLSSLLLNDGCYLLLLFVDYVSITNNNRSPPAPGGAGAPAAISGNTLVRDAIFILENQIPLFVLQRLHERITGGRSSVLDCMAGPVQEILHKLLFISKKPRPAPAPATCPHLLHLVHAYVVQPTCTEEGNTAAARQRHRRLTGRWRLATEYQRYANVRFKPRDFEDDVESSVLDVQHDRRGTLRIPRLRVDSNTWTVLRNLMALEEQQALCRRRPVTAYCLFMSQLACTAENVELLRRAGIVDHFLNNDEQAARGFADLCRGVVMDVDDLERNYLKPLWHELEERYESRGQRLVGWFRQGHNALIAATFLVLLILVACQVIQTFYAILWQPPRATSRGQEPS